MQFSKSVIVNRSMYENIAQMRVCLTGKGFSPSPSLSAKERDPLLLHCASLPKPLWKGRATCVCSAAGLWGGRCITACCLACHKTVPAVAGLGYWEKRRKRGIVTSYVLLLCLWTAWPLTSFENPVWSVPGIAQSRIWPPDFSLLVELNIFLSIGKRSAHNCQKKTIYKKYLHIEEN